MHIGGDDGDGVTSTMASVVAKEEEEEEEVVESEVRNVPAPGNE